MAVIECNSDKQNECHRESGEGGDLWRRCAFCGCARVRKGYRSGHGGAWKTENPSADRRRAAGDSVKARHGRAFRDRAADADVAGGGGRGDRAAHGGQRPQVPYGGSEGVGGDVDPGTQPDAAADPGAAADLDGQRRGARPALRQWPAEPPGTAETEVGGAGDPPFDRATRIERPRIAARFREPDRSVGPFVALSAFPPLST